MFAGSLIFETPIDTTGVETGSREIKGEFGGLKKMAEETGKAIESAFSNSSNNSVKLLEEKVKELEQALETVNKDLDGFVEYGTASTNKRQVNALVAEQAKLQNQLEAAKKKLTDAIITENQKQADSDRKAADKAQAAAEKTQNAMQKTASSAKKVTKETSEISKGFNSVSKAVKHFGTRLAGIVSSALVFTLISRGLREFTDYLGTSLKTSKEFSAQLAKLKGALLTAFQPIYTYVLPVIAKLMQYLTSAANVVAYFFSMLAGTSAENTAKAAEQLYKETNALNAVGGAAKKAKKALAGFDELNVLPSMDDASGGNGTVVAPDFSAFNKFKVPDIAEILRDKILEGDWYGAGKTAGESLMEGIEDVNWSELGSKIGKTVADAFFAALGLGWNLDPQKILAAAVNFVSGFVDGLSTSIQNQDWSAVGSDIIDKIVAALQLTYARYNPASILIGLLFSPAGDELASSASEFIGSCVGALAAAIVGAGGRLREIGDQIWSTIKKYVDDNIGWGDTPGEIINGLWNGIIDALSDAGNWIYNNIWVPFRDGFKEAFDMHSPSKKMEGFGWDMIAGLKNGFLGGLNNIRNSAIMVWTTIKGVFSNVKTWFETKFSTAWQAVKDVFSNGGEIFSGIKEGIETTFKEIVNKLIDGINLIITKPFNKINEMLNTIRSIEVLGVSPFRGLWSYNPLPIPQIPKLAQGAVLPANKPFMAVVGDQKHGTNIEAPLTTIQEAVANVMQEYMAANMAGHEATVAVLRELLEAVLGISIGDDVIANAVTRYNQKMAVVRGG